VAKVSTHMSRSSVYETSKEEGKLGGNTNSRATADAADAAVHTVEVPSLNPRLSWG